MNQAFGDENSLYPVALKSEEKRMPEMSQATASQVNGLPRQLDLFTGKPVKSVVNKPVDTEMEFDKSKNLGVDESEQLSLFD